MSLKRNSNRSQVTGNQRFNLLQYCDGIMSENIDDESEDVNPDSGSKESEEVFSYSLDEEEVDDLADKVEDILDVNQDDEEVKGLREDINSLTDSVAEMNRRLNSVEQETEKNRDLIEDKVEDAREKIISLAKKQKQKSDKDHSHPNIAESLSDIERDLEEIESALQTQLQDLESDMEKISNRESDLREKATNLAHNHLSLKDDYQKFVQSLEDEEDEDLDGIILKAQEEQVTTAKCQDCSSKVNIGLLRESECPFCDSQFEDLKTRFIRSDYLVTEDSNVQF